MAHILTRKYGNGNVRYTAVIRIREGARIVHREAKTFSQKTAAQRWAKAREVALEDLEGDRRKRHQSHTLAGLIRWYIDRFQTISKWQRSKQSHLEFLERHPFCSANAISLTASQLISHIQKRREAGAGPATVANDLIWLGVVLRAAQGVEGIPVRPDVIDEARAACRELRLVGKSKRRSRRPTAEEMNRLRDYCSRRDGRSEIPMAVIIDFAVQTARRESEICALLWEDIDAAAHTGIVRDAKHPTKKEGNHRTFKMTPEAWRILAGQPRNSDRVFPYNSKSVGAAFTRSCLVLGIKDLHFHDLRHEATSRLFERGYEIHEVAQFTLHESWSELKRYTNLRPENVRELPNAAAA